MKSIVSILRKSKIVLWVVLLVVITLNAFSVANAEQINMDSARGLTIFYYMQTTGIYFWFYLILCFVIPNIYSSDILLKKNNNYHYFEITRVGYKKYCYNNFLKNSIIAFLSVVFIHIYLLTMINFFISPLGINQYDASGIYVLLFPNIIINLIIYILFSGIGCVVFSDLILALQLYIKNIYLYRALGIGLGLLLFLVPVFLSNICSMVLHSKIFSILFGVFFIPNIIIPSLESYNLSYIPPLMGFLVTLAIYMSITLLLFKYKCRKEHAYE